LSFVFKKQFVFATMLEIMRRVKVEFSVKKQFVFATMLEIMRRVKVAFCF